MDRTINTKVDEIVNLIALDQVGGSSEKQLQATETSSSTGENLQDSLDYLRIRTKYLLFDLEATKRENAYLRKLLNDSQE